MLIQQEMWPKVCQEKMGWRLNVVTFNKTRVVEYTEEADNLDLFRGILGNET